MNFSIPTKRNKILFLTPFSKTGIPGIVFFLLLFLSAGFFCRCSEARETAHPRQSEPSAAEIARGWRAIAGEKEGRVVFAVPPNMVVLDLKSGRKKILPNIKTAGAPGRRNRGKTPRPSWSPDGTFFVFRYNGNVFVSGFDGTPVKPVINDKMDRSDETRWTWYRSAKDPGSANDWLAGPSTNGDMIIVNVSNPAMVRTVYGGGNVEKHCEITGTGKYIVYDDGSDIYVTAFGSSKQGIKISKGQSCRPCAAADDRAAWLPSPHTRYLLYRAADGKPAGEIAAPPNEELYRLNWSNHRDFAVHMYGSRGNTKIYVRKISTNQYLYIANGWDPDLWVDGRKGKN